MLPPRPKQLLARAIWLALCLISLPCICLGQNQPWIPPRSADLDRLSRSVEEALITGDPSELNPAMVRLADRIFDGDPGGTFTLSEDFHVGAGPYLKMILETMPPELSRGARKEMRLALQSRFENSPPVGFDASLDRQRSRRLLDLSPEIVGEEWLRPLTHAALERGDFGLYELLRSFSPMAEETPESFPTRPLRLPPINLDQIKPLSLQRFTLEESSDSAPWEEPRKQRAMLQSGKTLWVQSSDNLRAYDSGNGDLLWKTTPTPSSPGPDSRIQIRQQRPSYSVQQIAMVSTGGIHGLDPVSGEVLWTIFRERLLGKDERSSWSQLSEPIAVPGGFAIVIQQYIGNRLEAYMARITRDGQVAWVRSLGESTGATWLALHSWTAPPVYDRGRIFWNSGRGNVLALREQDGAILWSRDLQPRGPAGLRDHLEFVDLNRPALQVREDRVFLQVPGTSRIQQLSATTGHIHTGLPVAEGTLWEVSRSGDQCVMITTDGKVKSWRIPVEKNQSASLEWQTVWPNPSPGKPLSIDFREGEQILLTTSKVLSAIDSKGGWISHMAWVTPPRAIRFTRTGFSTITANGLYWWQSQGVQRDLERGDGEALLASLIRGETDLLQSSLAKFDLGRPDPVFGRLKNQLRWILDQPQRTLPEDLFSRSEIALISAENTSRQRIRIGWERAVNALQNEAIETADKICQLLLTEPVQRLREVQVTLKTGPSISAENAFTGLLLQLDMKPGNQERILKREARARDHLASLDSQTPERLRTLATSHPGTPTGRLARLRAAEAFYRAKDLEASLQQLDLLILRESRSDESVVARLRKAEVLREQGQRRKALAVIEELRRDHGNRLLTRTLDGETLTSTLSQRLDELKKQIPDPELKIPEVPGLPLEISWTGRLDLEQLRATTLHSLNTFPGYEEDLRYLILTANGARLIDSRQGKSLWKFDLEESAPTVRGGIFLNRQRQACQLLGLHAEGLLLWNKNHIFKIDLDSGRLVWKKSVPPLPSTDSGDFTADQQIWVHCVSNHEAIIAVSDSRRLYHLNPEDGQTRWSIADSGILIDTPALQNGQVLLGYSIPDKVEIRNLGDGAVLHSWKLKGDVPGLANAPVFAADGCLYGTEGGLITRKDADGLTLWEFRTPSPVSDIYLSLDQQQVIARMYWTEQDPTLMGINFESGDPSWQRKLPQELRRIVAVKSLGQELLVLCDGFTERSLLCLKTPETSTIQTVPEAELLWTRDLVPAYDAVELVEHGPWLLVVDRLRGDLSILDRYTGTPLSQKNGLEVVTHYTRPLGRLHGAMILGDQLIVVCARGSAAFHARQPLKKDTEDWFDLLHSLGVSEMTLTQGLLQKDTLAHQVEIRESLIKTTNQPLQIKKDASWELESLERLRALSGLEEIRVPYMPIQPVIDGSLSEPWEATAGLSMETPRFVRSLQGIGEIKIPWNDHMDLSAKMFLGWTESGLHIAIEVEDDHITVHDRDSHTWTGDCLLLILDTLGDGGQTPRNDDQVLTLAFVPPRQQEDPEAENPENPEGESGEEMPFPEDEDDAEEPEGEHVVLRRADRMGVTYEMTIPWDSILTQRGETVSSPWPGLKMRLGVAITDDDTGSGATKYLGLTPGMVLHKVMDRLWEGCCPDLLLPIRLVR